MANSRLERIGTIYSRITGLLRAGAMKMDDKPIWYEVYQRFPPKYEAKFERTIPNIDLPNIFYPEDVLRAKIHKNSSFIGAVNLSDQRPSNTQKCLERLKDSNDELQISEDSLKEAMEQIASEIFSNRDRTQASTSIASEFRQAQATTVNVKNIFNE